LIKSVKGLLLFYLFSIGNWIFDPAEFDPDRNMAVAQQLKVFSEQKKVNYIPVG
jgi:hypothetical protein